MLRAAKGSFGLLVEEQLQRRAHSQDGKPLGVLGFVDLTAGVALGEKLLSVHRLTLELSDAGPRLQPADHTPSDAQEQRDHDHCLPQAHERPLSVNVRRAGRYIASDPTRRGGGTSGRTQPGSHATRPAARSTRSALSVIISFGADRPQPTTSPL